MQSSQVNMHSHKKITSYFVGDSDSVRGQSLSVSVQWLIRVQPLLYPIGNSVNQNTKAFEHFEKFQSTFQNFDEIVLKTDNHFIKD
jgi:hypothetical protein